MTLTTERVDLPETASPTLAEPPQSPHRLRVIGGWAAVGAALAATGLLAVLSLDNGDRPSRIDTGPAVAQHGSVRAIEHRDDLAVQRREAMSRTVAEQGSISAIEHRDDLDAVALMARTNGLTGLSPAFLQPADRDLDDVWARRAEELAAIAEAAVAEGLTGLSPASLRPIGN
jgi:hypothetical protein